MGRLGARRPGRPRDCGPGASAEDAAVADLSRETLLAALAGSPARQREVLVLRYYLDLGEAQIADALDISPGLGQDPREPGPGGPAQRDGVDMNDDERTVAGPAGGARRARRADRARRPARRDPPRARPVRAPGVAGGGCRSRPPPRCWPWWPASGSGCPDGPSPSRAAAAAPCRRRALLLPGRPHRDRPTAAASTAPSTVAHHRADGRRAGGPPGLLRRPIGDDARIARLYREWLTVPGVTRGADDRLRARTAVELAMTAVPPGTDGYLRTWDGVDLVDVAVTDARITITLSGPGGTAFPEDTERVSVQQLVWTAQAAVGRGHDPRALRPRRRLRRDVRHAAGRPHVQPPGVARPLPRGPRARSG